MRLVYLTIMDLSFWHMILISIRDRILICIVMVEVESCIPKLKLRVVYCMTTRIKKTILMYKGKFILQRTYVGVNPIIILYKLSICKYAQPISQKKRRVEEEFFFFIW